MALQQNLSLVSSRLAADIARENVSAARGGHLPSLDLVASRYKNSCGGDYINANGTPYGSTSLDQYQNVIGIQFSVPIYSGGMVSSQVRQAVYQHRAAKERVERVARQTEHDARDAYLGVLSEISHVKALRRALESNATALERHRIGLRGRHAHRGGVLVAAAVDPGADRLRAQPLRLHGERGQAAAGRGHSDGAELEPTERAAQGRAAAKPGPPRTPPSPTPPTAPWARLAASVRLGGEQRLDEIEEPPKAPAMRLDEASAARTHALAQGRIGEEAAPTRRRARRIGHLDGAAPSISSRAISGAFACKGR